MDPISDRLLKQVESRTTTPKKGPVVLMYHSLSDRLANKGWPWALSSQTFRKHLQVISRYGWQTACMRDILKIDHLQNPDRTVAITFDDGFEDTFENGFRVLQSFGMTATWYVVTGYIGLKSGWRDSAPETGRMLGLDHLREMAASHMEIGSHSRTHPRLSKLNDQELDDELGGSKEELEKGIGCKVASFAYPFGDFDDRVTAAVRKAGYQSACTTSSGRFGIDMDPYEIRRVTVSCNDTDSTLARKLVFADNDVRWLRMAHYLKERLLARLHF